jgi:hypothetical protein
MDEVIHDNTDLLQGRYGFLAEEIPGKPKQKGGYHVIASETACVIMCVKPGLSVNKLVSLHRR